MASASKLASDGIGAFVVVYCGLNWIAYRRARVAKEAEKEEKQKK